MGSPLSATGSCGYVCPSRMWEMDMVEMGEGVDTSLCRSWCRFVPMTDLTNLRHSVSGEMIICSPTKGWH
eukprot:503522-Amphidinium_carterae.1